MKFRNITKIKNQMASLISEDANIKRYVYYLTREPLSLTARNKSGAIVKQPDVEVDLLFEDPHIYTSGFDEGILNELQVKIFVHRYMGDLTGTALGKNTFLIDIATPSEYDLLNEFEDRNSSIACLICDLIDDKPIGVGKASVVKYTEGRLKTSTGYNILSLFIEVATSNLRVNK